MARFFATECLCGCKGIAQASDNNYPLRINIMRQKAHCGTGKDPDYR